MSNWLWPKCDFGLQVSTGQDVQSGVGSVIGKRTNAAADPIGARISRKIGIGFSQAEVARRSVLLLETAASLPGRDTRDRPAVACAAEDGIKSGPQQVAKLVDVAGIEEIRPINIQHSVVGTGDEGVDLKRRSSKLLLPCEVEVKGESARALRPRCL